MNAPSDRPAAPPAPLLLSRADLPPFLGVVVAGSAMLALTWKRWGDPLVDLGRELVVPARIAAGERLYDDLRSHFGPLAWEIPALVARLPLPRVTTHLLATLSLSLLGLVALFRLARRLLPAPGAALATAAVAVVPFHFHPGGAMAFPYSWGALFVAVLGWWALELALDDRWPVAGLLLGLALATRIDATLPFLLALAIAALLDRREPISRALRCGAPMMLVAALAHLPALARVGGAELRHQLVDPLLRVPAAWKVLYASVSGFDAPFERLLQVGLAATAAALVAGGAGAAAVHAARLGPAGRAAFAAAVAGGTFLLLWSGTHLRSVEPRLSALSPFRPLPLLALGTAALLAARAFRYRPPFASAAAPDRALLWLSAAAATTSLRILLNARGTSPYGSFGLVLPVLVGAILLLDRFPRLVERWRTGSGDTAAAAARALLLGSMVAHATLLGGSLRAPGTWFSLASPEGTIVVTPRERGETLAAAIAFLRHESRPGERLAAFPEAGVFNLWTGLRSPLASEQYLPDGLSPEQERELARRLDEDPPEWVLVTNVDYSGWGSGRFGAGYARPIGEWIEHRYRPAARFGSDGDPGFPPGAPGLVLTIFRRQDGAGR